MLAAGAEVAQSEVDGKPVGPLRVWPGGLAMSRTIGDHEAGATCTCQPDVRQVPKLDPTQTINPNPNPNLTPIPT